MKRNIIKIMQAIRKKLSAFSKSPKGFLITSAGVVGSIVVIVAITSLASAPSPKIHTLATQTRNGQMIT